MESNQQTQIAEQTAQLGKKWEWILIPGIIFVAFGIITLSVPITPVSMTSTAVSLYFLISGSLRLIEAIGLKQYFDSERRFFLAALSLIMSALLFRLQNMQPFGIAIALSFYFFVAAAAQLVRRIDLQKAPSWRWAFVSVGTTLALGVYIVYSIPPLRTFVPSDLIGLDLIGTGISMIGFSQSIGKFSTKYYSAKEPLRTESSRKEEYRKEPLPLRRREDSATISREAH